MEKLEVILGLLIVAFLAIGALVAVLVVQPWFWLAVIAITLIGNL